MSSAALDIDRPIGSFPEAVQRRLTRLNDSRLRPRLEPVLALQEEMELRELEITFLEAERERVSGQAAGAPEIRRSF